MHSHNLNKNAVAPTEEFIGYRNEYAKEATELQKALADLSTTVSIALGDIRTLKARISPVMRPEAPYDPDKAQCSDGVSSELTQRIEAITHIAKIISQEVRETFDRLAV